MKKRVWGIILSLCLVLTLLPMVAFAAGTGVKVAGNADGIYSFKQAGSGVMSSVGFGDNEWKNPFSDVKDSDWFYGDVQYVYEQGVMEGTSNTTFSPHETTTRGMIVTILYRMENEPSVAGAYPFDDVESGSYYENAITWAKIYGIAKGYSQDRFGPDDPITREQMAAILYHYAQHKDDGFTGAWMFLPDFPDRYRISDYAYEAVCWMTMNGIINGRDDGTLDPKGNVGRAEAAAMLQRFCELITK